jgi:sarcosine oxidase subunit gamma
MNDLMPDTLKKRSLAYRQSAGAEYAERSEGAIAYRMKADSAEQVARAALLDLSVVSRTGVRGVNAEHHLRQVGLPIPAKPNQAAFGANDEMVLRLSQKEFWLLNGLTDQNDNVEKFNQLSLPPVDCYSLFCQDSHAWFMLTGDHLPDIMAKVCGIDLRTDAFPVGSIAQTSVARVNAIVVSHQVNSIPVFSLLSDSASSEYLWGALLDAIQEFDGTVVGLNALTRSD